MGQLARLHDGIQLPAQMTQTPELRYGQLPEEKRQLSEARLALLNVAMEKQARTGHSRNKCLDWLLASIRTDQLPTLARNALAQLNKVPGKATLHRWWSAVENSDHALLALADERKGRQAVAEGWELRAVELYNRPTKPCMSTVAIWLQQEGWDINPQRVRRVLKNLPAHLGENGVKRMGRHYYNQNIKPHVIRDKSDLPVGFIYEGDGHCCDVYVQHPKTGSHYRPEFTPWIDVKSQYIVGWWLSDAESSNTTIYSLTAALANHGHVPAAIHVDPGSGFKNKMVDQEITGFLQRFSIEPMYALPGNAKGKGLIEGLFHWFEERLGKKYESYCGHCRTDDALSRLSDKIKKGLIEIPSYKQYWDAIAEWVEWHNNTPKKSLGDKSPAELWAELTPTPLHCSVEELTWPQEQRTVQRSGVSLWNRLYRADLLEQFNGKKVLVQYNLHNDSRVVIRDFDQRFICDAKLYTKQAAVPDSRVAQLEQQRLQGKLARIDQKKQEALLRSRPVIEHTDTLAAIEQLSNEEPLALPETGPEIDLLSVDYLDN